MPSSQHLTGRNVGRYFDVLPKCQVATDISLRRYVGAKV
jgi:hypothetical protein